MFHRLLETYTIDRKLYDLSFCVITFFPDKRLTILIVRNFENSNVVKIAGK